MTEEEMAGIPQGARVQVTAEQVSSDLGGEVVILDLRAGAYFGLEAVGARVWELLQESRTFGEIVESLLSEYEVEPERCREDLSVLLNELRARGLVQVT